MIKKEKLSSIFSVPVTVVIPMRNAATTLKACLGSISRQSYPVEKIIVVDDVSKDNSRDIVASFAKTSKIPVRLLRQEEDRGIASSYNRGIKEATSPFVVLMSSDISLPTEQELAKLVEPLLKGSTIGASYSTCNLPKFIWDKYNFWEKYHAARMVENYSSLMVLKFDCVRREAFLSIGGFDDVNFGGDDRIGGEDADFTNRLKHHWKIVRSEAKSHHLHYIAQDYSLRQILQSKKMYARSYGRFLRKSPLKDIRASLIFLIKPMLAFLPFIPYLGLLGLVVLVVFSFVYTKKMFFTPATLFDPKIFSVPVLNIFFVYFETFWIIQAFLSYKKLTSACADNDV